MATSGVQQSESQTSLFLGRECNSRPIKYAETAEKRTKLGGWPQLKPAATSKGCRGATLCKFTTYSAGRYDGIPRTCSRLRGKAGLRTCSRLRGKAGESKRADRRRRRLYFTASTISRSVAHLETEETPLLLWSRVIPAGTDFQNFSPA